VERLQRQPSPKLPAVKLKRELQGGAELLSALEMVWWRVGSVVAKGDEIERTRCRLEGG
jgi:hypothetical protein